MDKLLSNLLTILFHIAIISVTIFILINHSEEAIAERGIEFGNRTLRFSGYGTFSYTFDDRDNMMPFRDVSRSPIESMNELKKNSTWQMDSRFGIQADYQFVHNIEFVMQGVLRDKAGTSFGNSIESAYLGVKPLPEIDVRAGRLGYDAFLMSDIRHTGYAYLWVRPPTEFYNWVPIFSVNGIDAAWSVNQGDAQWRIKAQGGKSSFNVVMGEDVLPFEGDDLWTLTVSRQSGPFKIKAGYSQFTSLNEVPPFIPLQKGLETLADATQSAFPDISKEALSLRNDIYFKNNDISYLTLGAAYDDGTFIAQAEIGRSTATGDVLPNGEMGYINIGYRLGNFTPHFTFSSIDPNADLHQPVSDWSAIDQETFQSQAIYIVNSTRMEQYTYSFGLRWDFHNQAALKIQWDNTHIKPYGYGLWWREIDALLNSSTANLYSLSMEYIF